MRRASVFAIVLSGSILFGTPGWGAEAGKLQGPSALRLSAGRLSETMILSQAIEKPENLDVGRPASALQTKPDAPPSSQPIGKPPLQSGVIEIQNPNASAPSFAESICLGMARASLENDVPVDFFTRLIWQESHFDPKARSYAGAQGIAQFMSATARSRGLADPFDPLIAIKESARFLKELRSQFGNLGLAAAAYNAGPGRVRAWLDGRGPLPGQTQAYVRIITGRPADTWVGVSDKPEDRMGSTISCDAIAKLLAPRGRQTPAQNSAFRPQPRAASSPWALQLIGGRSETKALADYRNLQRKYPAILGNRQPLVVKSRMVPGGAATWYLVRVGEPTRERAMQLCARLEAAGGKCIVQKN